MTELEEAAAGGRATTTLRLGSFNLLSGRSLSDGLVEAARLPEAIAATGADVLALQEVDRGQPRSGATDQPRVSAEALGAPDWRFIETVHGTPGEEGWVAAGVGPQGPGPQYGIALLSKLPVKEWHVLRLEAARGLYPMPIPGRPPKVMWLKDEPRAAVAAVLEEPRITVACTHLSFVPVANARQLRRVKRWLERLPGPRVLLGDLNLPPAVARRVTAWTPLVDAPTFPAPAPRTQLDHALADGLPEGSAARGHVREMVISDHRAVLVDLDLPVL